MVFLVSTDILLGFTTVSFVFYGLIGGLLLRDLFTYYRLRQNWPMLRRVLNWEEINELLHNNQA